MRGAGAAVIGAAAATAGHWGSVNGRSSGSTNRSESLLSRTEPLAPLLPKDESAWQATSGTAYKNARVFADGSQSPVVGGSGDAGDAGAKPADQRTLVDSVKNDDPRLAELRGLVDGAPLRALLEPLSDDFQRVTVEQLRRELWKYEAMVQVLEAATEEAENPRLRGTELLESLGIDGAQ